MAFLAGFAAGFIVAIVLTILAIRAVIIRLLTKN